MKGVSSHLPQQIKSNKLPAPDSVITNPDYKNYFCTASRLTVVTPIKKQINGSIYERSFIEAWIKKGAPWDPADKSLLTQHAFRPLSSDELKQWQNGKVAAQKRINLECGNPRIFNTLFLQTEHERRAQIQQAVTEQYDKALKDATPAPDEFICPISTLFIINPVNLPIIDATDSSKEPTVTARPYEGPLIKQWLADKKRCPMTNTARSLHDLRAVKGSYQRKRDKFLRAHPKYYQEILPPEKLKKLSIILDPAPARIQLIGRKRPSSDTLQRRHSRYRGGTVAL